MNNETKKNTLLLIDNDASLTDVLSKRLNSVGFNVLVANTSDMGLKLSQISRPEIILLDILMQNKDGRDILSAIKTNPSTENIPVIILSADIDVNSKVYGFLSGANDYIVKPFRFAEVLARINTQLRILNMQKELKLKNKELLEKNVLLEKLAITDPLTRLYNRAYILDRLKTEILRSARYQESIAFIMIDVDHFKKINDTFGHLTGDAVLKIVANQLKFSVRDVDIIGRYGGEEFVVICPNTDLTGAKIIGERIRQNTFDYNFSLRDQKIQISLSVGISADIPKVQTNVDTFISKQIGDADIALYKAKSYGRNRVEIFTPERDPLEGTEKESAEERPIEHCPQDISPFPSKFNTHS